MSVLEDETENLESMDERKESTDGRLGASWSPAPSMRLGCEGWWVGVLSAGGGGEW